MAAELATFAEIVEVLDTLPVILRNARRTRRLSVREVARQTGLSFSTISRMENAEEFTSVSLRAVLAWLDAPADAPAEVGS
jgi:transcriptional regulator with XRE-family HTH domain